MSRNRAAPSETGRAVRFRTTFRNTIHDMFRSKGWVETESDTDWDVAWVDKDWMRENFLTLSPTFGEMQRINHFPNHYELTRKDNLIKNLKRTQRALLREGLHDEAARYDFFPGTYVLPADYGLFVEEFKNHPSGTIWIMKPTGSAQGKGIFLFNKLAQINDWKKDASWKTGGADESKAAAYVVQRYIENPQLIGGKKFDLRLYVLVTSYAPLTVYMCVSPAYHSGTTAEQQRQPNSHAPSPPPTHTQVPLWIRALLVVPLQYKREEPGRYLRALNKRGRPKDRAGLRRGRGLQMATAQLPPLSCFEVRPSGDRSDVLGRGRAVHQHFALCPEDDDKRQTLL